MKSNEIKPGRAHEDIWCIGMIIIWTLAGLLGAVCIALWVVTQIYLHDPFVDAWTLLFIGMVASVITLHLINKWLAGGKK